MVRQRLIALERTGWEALVAGNGGAYDREHLTANAVMAFPFGVLDRAAAVEAIDSAPPWERFELRDAEVVELNDSSGVVVYHVTAQRGRPEAVLTLMGSTFVHGEDGWKLASFHPQSAFS